MVALTTPTTQTVYGSVVDQSVFQNTGSYINTPPSTYLTRILARMMSAAHSPNTVLRGLDVISVSGLNTNIISLTLSSGSIIIDSNIVHFPNQTVVPVDTIPITAPSKLRVAIFASYTFDALTASTTSNKVTFTSYIFDMNDVLVSPSIWGGGEKILLTVYDVNMSGPRLTPLMHIPNWVHSGTNISDAGGALRLYNVSNVGDTATYTLTGLVIGTIYRITCQGTVLSQILISGIPLGTGNINAVFTATANSEILTLRVNSNLVGDEATFRSVKVFEDNTHIVRSILPANTRSAGGNLKALSVNNPSNTMRTEISIAGHGIFKVKGDNPLVRQAEISMLNSVDAAIATWILDIPKTKPTATSLAYGVTGIFL